MSHQLLAYEVQPGDSTDQIINRYFGPVSQVRKTEIKHKIAGLNPHLPSVRSLSPGQLMMLATPRQYCAAPSNFERILELESGPRNRQWIGQLNDDWRSMDQTERGLAYQVSPYVTGSGAASLSMLNTTFRTNAPLLGEVASLYESYRAGDLTKGQYDYRRRVALQTLSDKLGPTQSLLYGGRRPGEVIRINRQSGVAPTADIDREMRRMTRLAKTASRGTVALSVVGLGIACREIANTPDRDRQNEILVESGGGLVVGTAYAFASGLGLMLLATPVGWGAALAIGVGGVLASYAGSRFALSLYDFSGRKIDFVESMGIDGACGSGSQGHTNSAIDVLNRSSMLKL